MLKERECWQQNVSRYLLKHLSALCVEDSFAVYNWAGATTSLQKPQIGGSAFSVGVTLFSCLEFAALPRV